MSNLAVTLWRYMAQCILLRVLGTHGQSMHMVHSLGAATAGPHTTVVRLPCRAVIAIVALVMNGPLLLWQALERHPKFAPSAIWLTLAHRNPFRGVELLPLMTTLSIR